MDKKLWKKDNRPRKRRGHEARHLRERQYRSGVWLAYSRYGKEMHHEISKEFTADKIVVEKLRDDGTTEPVLFGLTDGKIRFKAERAVPHGPANKSITNTNQEEFL